MSRKTFIHEFKITMSRCSSKMNKTAFVWIKSNLPSRFCRGLGNDGWNTHTLAFKTCEHLHWTDDRLSSYTFKLLKWIVIMINSKN